LQPSDHPLAIHFQNGMTIQEAQQIVEVVMHGS
jgi:hypothetical protein